MKYLVIFILATSSILHAELPKSDGPLLKSQWYCGFSANLVGDPTRFITYGRDQWTGEAILNCVSGQIKKTKIVKISYLSQEPGFGADQLSILQLKFYMASDQEPSSVVEKIVASDDVSSGFFSWRIERQSYDIFARVATDNNLQAMRSLKLGILSVQSDQ